MFSSRGMVSRSPAPQRWPDRGPRLAAGRAAARGEPHDRRKAPAVTGATPDPIRLVLNISDPALADRLVGALSDLEGILLVPVGEPADALVVMPDGEGFLTPVSERL